jgi:hypothetical protein
MIQHKLQTPPPLTNTADPVTTDQMPKQISDSSPTNGVDNTESPTTANKKDNVDLHRKLTH